ncbi:CNNM domain-containing protein [Larsenimonas rhizosphaerae]|uniref:CNNM domain-containing protein n=1 Tax=Larsenimonas rhizosphaerae TaxID=2944682 RepID=A0AA42CX11_9GAMM|nr:CNNM domain-containing protein [Larsenimonas rhizosphaerae]MCM2130624.1 CNNM domain-containing protein [Larsenimonas rhizosphaerae]MCX2523328.1 CNNM domain-containing protein [Larsenimonas rhizosphaerae]
MILLIVFALISIVISFLCSIMEAAILSLTPSYIAQLKDTRPKLHSALSALKKDIDRPLAAILTLNTVAHTVGATGVGAQVTALFGETYIGVASAIMTLLILVLSEIIPKTIGANYWRGLAPLLPVLLKPMIWVLSPFIWLSEIITRRISRQTDDVDLRSEISTMARIGLEEKALDKDEARTIVNMLNLHEISISDAMTPRTVCETVTPAMKVSEFDAHYSHMQFTRFPVMDEDEHAAGYIHKADTYHADPDGQIGTLMRPVTAMQESDSVEKVFTTMLKEHNHLSVVYDDNGTWVGLITMEDVFETILGQDIVDETDHVQNLRKYARLRWLKRARRQRSLS